MTFGVGPLSRAVEALQDAAAEGNFIGEGGISDEQAAAGLIAALKSLGVGCDAKPRLVAKAVDNARQQRAYVTSEVERARRAGLTPEEREAEDTERAEMRRVRGELLERVFRQSIIEPPTMGWKLK